MVSPVAGWGAETGETSSPLRSLLATFNRDKGLGAVNWGRFSNNRVDYLIEQAGYTLGLAALDGEIELHVEGQPAGLWFYRVRATGAGGEGPRSNVQTAGVVPGAPQLAPIDNPDGDGQYVADWSDVVGASSYSLQEDDGAAFDSPVTRYSGPSSQYPLRNQPEGTWYYRVRASNMVGAGPWSNIESVTVWGEKRQVFLPLVVYR